MESQFRHDDLIPPLPIASPPTYLLLIDSRVSNYQDIINAKQPSVHHIVFDAPSRPTHSTKLIKNIEDQIAALGLSAITSIGLVQHNDGLPFYEIFGPLSDVVKPQIHAVETHDPDFQTWNSISIFITKLRRNYGIVNFDMMACALYSNPDWKYIIDRLTALTGVTVRASTDDTGAASLGGDWFLESHTGVNLKSVYFTDAIESYNGILVSTTGDSSGVPWSSTAKKLILIDHTIPDIHVIINAMNDDTYALVFNTQYDTEDTILSKLRFLSGTNRYILDSFYYGDTAETAVLTPAQLRTETNWQFYPDSTPTIKVIQPVFFQRAIPNATTTTTTSEPDVPDISSYVPRDRIRITDLDEIYEIAKAAGEANDEIEFECIGIIQHAPLTTLGYKLTNMTSHATIENVSSVDPNLSSWSQYSAFLERLKSVYHMTTLDLMACALYANPDWKYIIDHLAAQHAITIRASLDNTGNTNDGGNWILETAEIHLTTVYFTNAIHEWAHLLPTSLTTLRFDGVDDAVNLGVPAWSYSTQFRSTMTIECWFKTTDTNNQKLGNFVSRWISGGYASHSMFLIGMNPTGEITCWITNASGGFASTQTSAAYKDTLWHHVAVTYNSSTGVLSMYIDGVFTNNSTNSAYPTTSSFGLLSSSTLMRLIFGSDDAGTSPNTHTDRQFRGSLSDIRIWNVVRSDAEIAANYRRRLIGNETGLIGYWKLHQGNGTGWTTYNRAIDSTSNRTHGTLISMGASPSSSWVTTTDLSFNPRISTLTLGANNGVYNTSDGSFSFIDPSSNSLGTFSYAVTPSSIATVANGAATTKTIYATSGAISIPTLSVYDFPEIASLSSWQIDISFTVTGGSGTWRGLVGDMYNVVNDRGWGLWVSSSNRIHWSWVSTTAEPSTIAVSLNTAYVLTAAQSSGTITLTLRTVSNGAIQTGSFSVGANVIGKGPVTIGGWQIPNSENFPGTISYVNVSVPTNQRVVTISSGTAGTPATVTATQDSSLDFGVGTQTAALTVNSSSPTIGALSMPAKNFGDASFNLTAPTSNSGGAFTYTSSNTDVATVTSGGTVTIVGAGSTTITATQAAADNYSSGSVSASLVVSKATPVLSAFTVSSGRTYGASPFSALAYPASASNGTITYSSTDSTVATIDSSSGMITLLKAGYVNFIATQQATAFYNSATKTSNTMTVYRQILPLTRSSPTSATINKIYGESYFNVIATNASNGGTITYETNNPGVAGIVGSATAGVISVVSVGSATITARREDTDQYTSDPVSWTVEVARATTTLTGLTDLSYNVTTAPFTVAASSLSDGAVTYSLQNPSSSVLTIHPTTGLVTLRSAGSAVIVASQAQGTLYLAPADITATITVTSAGNALQGATITSTTSFAAVNLEGASLAGVSITNTAFTAANLTNANLTNAVIVSANFASADLSGATLAGATITGATFTAASLKNADLSGAVLTNTVFTGSDLSGARLTGVDASGASFANARLTNVDMTGANIENVNFTNTSIKGANIADVSFSPLQKLQLLKNSDNRDIGQIIIPAVTGSTVLAAISESSPLRAIENLDLATATVAVVVPTTSTSATDVLPDVVLNVSDNDKFYLPINESEFFQIEGVKYFATGGIVRNYLTNAVVEVISYNGTPVWLLAGSIVGLVLQTNTLNSSSFVVPSRMLLTETTPFMPTTLPTSNNTTTPIVYSSDNTNVATIDASSGQITITGNTTGFVRFTATQVQSATYAPGVSVSNTMFVDRTVEFTLTGLNQVFNLSTLATLDASSISVESTDATAVFYVRLSDMNNVFMYQSDANDITNVTADDIKYYVFHRKWPTELKVNPSHAMLDKPESAGMLGHGEGYTADKSLIKHDFIRYISLRLFNTIHGVDLFHNEAELLENTTFLGETVRNNIDNILSSVSTTSASQNMTYDASGNKYLTNDASGNTNLCRELMRHIASVAPSRFYGNVPNHAGLKNVPFLENDTLQYKLVVQAAATQNLLTGVSEIPSRSYTIKFVLKNTVNASTNANAVVTDSEMYPNAYPYSTSVVTYAPTAESSSGVYNIYSPPAPIPFARFGYNGWYYTNSAAWVNVAPAVRNHVKWLVSANTATSKVSDLQYIRVNLKIHNTAALPYLMVYTQAGSSRKYAVVGGSGSLVNGAAVYSFYMNFNSYAREPATIGATNAALAYTVGRGSFANNETITSIAVETDSNAAAGNVEFTLSSVVIGELNREKEYGFEAAVPGSYP
jgi:uncharacterized protein YjbI with pentapeptide repeats